MVKIIKLYRKPNFGLPLSLLLQPGSILWRRDLRVWQDMGRLFSIINPIKRTMLQELAMFLNCTEDIFSEGISLPFKLG